MSEEYDLRKSTEKIGELYPVIVSKSGEIVDGFHRINAKANWRREVREDIDTPEKVLKARLISNKFRRQVSAVEVRGWINDLAEIALVEHGVQPGEISGWVAEETGYSERQVRFYLDEKYKEQRGFALTGQPTAVPTVELSDLVSVAEPIIREAEPVVDLETANGLKKAAKALEREAKRKVKAKKTPEQIAAEKAEKKRKKRERAEAKKQALAEREKRLREKVRKEITKEVKQEAKKEAQKELVENPEFIDTLIEENKELFEEKIQKRREEADEVLKKRFALKPNEDKPRQKTTLEDQYLQKIQNTFLEITSWNLSLWIGLGNENREQAYRYFQAINQWTQWLIKLKDDRNAAKPDITSIAKESPESIEVEYKVVD